MLEEMSSSSSALSLTELSRQTELSVPTIQRLTATLVQAGYLEKDVSTKKYYPTVKTVDLLYGYLSRNEFAKTAWPHLVRLREKLKLDVSLSVPRSRSMIYVHRLPGYRGNFDNTLPGRLLPMHLSASGRCYLASHSDHEIEEHLSNTELVKMAPKSLIKPEDILTEISTVRELGYCLVNQEATPGLMTLACPILRGAKVIAGASVHAPIAGISPKSFVEQALPELVSVTYAMKTR